MSISVAAQHGLEKAWLAKLTTRERRHARIALRDGPGCFYCGCPLREGSWDHNVIHLDHVVAQSSGGSGSIENLVRSCHVCNTRKSSRPGWFFVLLEHLDLTGPHPPVRTALLKGLTCTACGCRASDAASWERGEDGRLWLTCLCGHRIAGHRWLRRRTTEVAVNARSRPT